MSYVGMLFILRCRYYSFHKTKWDTELYILKRSLINHKLCSHSLHHAGHQINQNNDIITQDKVHDSNLIYELCLQDLCNVPSTIH